MKKIRSKSSYILVVILPILLLLALKKEKNDGIDDFIFQSKYAFSTSWTSGTILSLPDDVLSAEGAPLLSWRAVFVLNRHDESLWENSENSCSSDFELNDDKPWDDVANLSALVNRPPIFYFPNDTDSSKLNYTCLLRIEEVHKQLTSGNSLESRCPYLILVAPENAVPWTKPQDVTIKDIVNREVNLLYSNRTYYIGVDGNVRWGDYDYVKELLLKL